MELKTPEGKEMGKRWLKQKEKKREKNNNLLDFEATKLLL